MWDFRVYRLNLFNFVGGICKSGYACIPDSLYNVIRPYLYRGVSSRMSRSAAVLLKREGVNLTAKIES